MSGDTPSHISEREAFVGNWNGGFNKLHRLQNQLTEERKKEWRQKYLLGKETFWLERGQEVARLQQKPNKLLCEFLAKSFKEFAEPPPDLNNDGAQQEELYSEVHKSLLD